MKPSDHEKILFVDDEPNVLEGYKRQLRKHFHIETAVGGPEALKLICASGPYAIVVADMRMPSMNGIELLGRVLTLAPDTVRIMLTGNADQKTAIDAINQGHIFRFLTKPCAPEMMQQVLEAGLAQYRLVVAEKELLEKTLLGSISILIEVLSMTYPAEFGRAKKLRNYVRETAGVVEYPNFWELEIAALLSPIGHLTLPAEAAAQGAEGIGPTDLKAEIASRVPEISSELLSKIPRLETVAQIIRYSSKLFNGAGIPRDALSGERLPLGSRILKILGDFMDIEADGKPRAVALRLLHNRPGWYDPQLLDAINLHYMPPLPVLVPKSKRAAARTARTVSADILAEIEKASPEQPYSLNIAFEELAIGDVLVADLHAIDGSLLLSEGNAITEAIMEKLKLYAEIKGIQEPIQVAVGVGDA
jgi:response regulator RpfG family c-di-GMP phosphodiesterase